MTNIIFIIVIPSSISITTQSFFKPSTSSRLNIPRFIILTLRTNPECLFTDTGHEYSGNRSRTVSGKVCQGWFVQYPHKHNFTDPDLFPDKTLIEAKNYCRNPNRQSGTGPWCFTLDPDTRIESCGLSRCLGQYTLLCVLCIKLNVYSILINKYIVGQLEDNYV